MSHTGADVPRASAWRRRAQVTMLLLAVIAAVTGAWAEFAPVSFYHSFPGAGHHWLPRLGPYNEHMFRDFGALNLGLAGASGYAAASGARAAVIASAAAWETYSVPHLAFHLLNSDGYAAADVAANIASLVLLVLLAATAWFSAVRMNKVTPAAPASSAMARQPTATRR